MIMVVVAIIFDRAMKQNVNIVLCLFIDYIPQHPYNKVLLLILLYSTSSNT